MTTTETENKELVRELWHEVIVGGNLDVIDELVADDIVAHSNAVPEPIHGSDEYRQFIAEMRTGMSDPEMRVDEVIADDDTAALRYSSTFTHDESGFMGIEPTGKEVEIQGMYFARIEDGQIVESWGQNDLLGAMQQLGVVEPPGE